MGKTSNVMAAVKSGNKVYTSTKEVKVTTMWLWRLTVHNKNEIKESNGIVTVKALIKHPMEPVKERIKKQVILSQLIARGAR